MRNLIEYLLTGLIPGTVYGLIALPMSLVHSTTNAVDVGVGGYTVAAGLVASAVGGVLGGVLGIVLAIGLAFSVSLLYRFFANRGAGDAITFALATFGVLMAIESVLLWRHGPNGVIESLFRRDWKFADIQVSPQGLINLGIGLALVGIVLLLVHRTPLGLSLRACASNAVAAALAGIAVNRVRTAVFILEGLLAGIAAILLLFTTGLDYRMGTHLSLVAVSAAMIFGFRGPASAFAGGLLLGVVEVLAIAYTDTFLAASIPYLFILGALMLGGNRLRVRA